MKNLVNAQSLNGARRHPERVVTVSSRRALSQCPRRFTYRHSALRVEEDSPSLQKGSKLHSVLEALYQDQEHPDNDDVIKVFIKEWEDLDPIAVEQPFLFRFEDYIVGGVIDLVAGIGGEVYVVDHKLSTGQYLSQLPMMSVREQLGVYTYALRQAGVPAVGGIVSRLKLQQDTEGIYARSLAVADGINEVPSDPWGYTRLANGRLIRAILIDSGHVLRVEREYMEFDKDEPAVLVRDLVVCWKALYGQDFRIRGTHCGNCPYLLRCNDDAEKAVSAPAVELGRLHPELFRRLTLPTTNDMGR